MTKKTYYSQLEEMDLIHKVVTIKLESIDTRNMKQADYIELQELRKDKATIQDCIKHLNYSRYNQGMVYYQALRVAFKHFEGGEIVW